MTPLDGQPEIALPPAVMQNTIPDALDQVPSREDVANTPGFKHFASKFPEKQDSWQTTKIVDFKTFCT